MKKILYLKSSFLNFLDHPLFAGSFIMIFGSNAVSFLNYLYHLIIGRMLGPAYYGELAAMISLLGLFGIIPGSITLVIIKCVSSAKDEKEKRNLIVWFKKKIFLFSLIYSLFILMLAPFIADFLKINNLTYLMLLAAFSFFSLQASLNRSVLQGLLRFKEMVGSILAENTGKLFFSIILVYLGFQVGGAIFALVFSSVFGFYITVHYLKMKNSSADFKSEPDIKTMIKFSIPVALQSFAVTSLYSSDVILVKHFFPAHDAGIYAALSNLGKIIFFGAGPIGAVMFPLVSQRHAKGETYSQIFRYSFIGTLILALSVLTLYWFFPELAIKLLYGDGFLGASGLLIWFGIFMSLFTLSALLISYGLSLGRSSIVFLPLGAAVVQIFLIWFFHRSLFTVILISTAVAALLLLALLIYSTYAKRN